MGSPLTSVLPAALLRDTEIVPDGESQDTSSVPACVTIADGTTVTPTPPVSVVQADAAGARTSAATTANVRIRSDDASRTGHPQPALMRHSHGRRQHPRVRRGAALLMLGLMLL